MDKEYYEFEFKEIVPSFKMAFSFVFIACLYAIVIVLLVFIGSLLKPYPVFQLIFQVIELCFILFLLLRSIFCICFIVDDDSRPFESLRQSFEITRDNFFKTLAILFITIAIMIVALIPVLIIVGIFNLNDDSHSYLINLAFYVWEILFLPFVQVIIMVTYRKLVYSHQDVDDDIAETN
jgi:hypothetical protein